MVSAALSPDGVPRRAIELARAAGTIAMSDAVHTEIAAVLARPKFARVITEARRRDMLELLTAAALWISPSEKVQVCRDPKDDCYLELALAAGAHCIISGDQDLLAVTPWRGILVLRPADFIALRAK